jgi:hypothetical protein
MMNKKLTRRYFSIVLLLLLFVLVWVGIHESMHVLFCFAQGEHVSFDVNWKLPAVICSARFTTPLLTFIYAIAPYALAVLVLFQFVLNKSGSWWFRLIPYAPGFDLVGNLWAFLINSSSDFGTIKAALPGIYLWTALVIALTGCFLFGIIIYNDIRRIEWGKWL